MANQMETNEIVGSIDVISYSERVDSLIKSETASFFGDSPPYTFASLVDSAIRSSSASYEADYEPHNSTSTSLPSHSQPSYEADDKTFTRHSNKAFSGINREPMLWKTTLHSRFVHTVELLSDHQSKGTSKTIPSSLSFPSYSEESNASSLPTPWSEGEILSLPNLKAFTWNELKNATGNFRPDSFLGEGEFGFVYRGWIDEHTFTASKPGSGMVVAVKRLWPGNFQGYKEWLAGVNYLGQLHHPNLFKLIGYCLDVENRLLVYEFMPKGSLENYLFRRVSQPLSWLLRMKVAIGFARGLSFLHDAKSQVIHRNFKASKILLDAVGGVLLVIELMCLLEDMHHLSMLPLDA